MFFFKLSNSFFLLEPCRSTSYIPASDIMSPTTENRLLFLANKNCQLGIFCPEVLLVFQRLSCQDLIKGKNHCRYRNSTVRVMHLDHELFRGKNYCRYSNSTVRVMPLDQESFKGKNYCIYHNFFSRERTTVYIIIFFNGKNYCQSYFPGKSNTEKGFKLFKTNQPSRNPKPKNKKFLFCF